ncbi:substrate-binding domain-containing protein, partial [Kibdelosporangium lantanae]
ATGQEAYSLAMLFADALGPERFRQRVKIYATDVDNEALAYARQASYTQGELENLAEDQVGEYFEQQGNRYVFRKDLRRSVIFGRNDLVQDAPISRIDLLVCRNTLMYFNAETQSIKDEAAKAGVKQLLTTNANSQLSKQISDIQDMINQGAQVLIVAPLNSDGLEPALSAARAKNIPVLTIDRKVNATACKDYVAFLGSNFVEQGKRAAQQMAKALNNKGKVAILLGSSGNNVTTDRTNGFVDELKATAPDIQVVAQQTGDFARDKGQQVMEQLIQATPDINGVYAENDEMALGALVALTSAGKKPGTDVQVVSVDGTRNAVQKVTDGQMYSVVESNPRFGPLSFSTLQTFLSGQPVSQNVVISDKLYTKDNATAEVANAY